MAIRKTHRSHRSAARALLSALLISSSVEAAYTVQIGAFRNPSQSYATDAEQVASVYVTEHDNGIKALSVGSYDSRAAAAEALRVLKTQYPDAYIATLSESALLFDGSTAVPATASSNIALREGPSASERVLLDQLSDAERSRVVYLDGVLHIKNGSDFIPLSEYSSN